MRRLCMCTVPMREEDMDDRIESNDAALQRINEQQSLQVLGWHCGRLIVTHAS